MILSGIMMGNGPWPPMQPVCLLVIVEKMHLCRLDFRVKNSIVAVQERRNNFLFARLE